MAEGDIGDTVVDSIDFEESTMSIMCDICHVTGDIYAITYINNDGYIKTISISANGNIGSVIDTLAFSLDTTANYPRLIHVSGDVFAVVYEDANEGRVETFTISAAGTIGSVIDTSTFANGVIFASDPAILHISGDVYAIAYPTYVFPHPLSGFVVTLAIAADGTIGAVIDRLQFEHAYCTYLDFIHVSGNYYAISYSGPGNHGWLVTVEIDSSGNIGDAVVDSLEFDTTYANFTQILNVYGDYYAIIYSNTDNDGAVCTVTINNLGQITVIDTGEWESDRGINMVSFLHISGNVYAVPYTGTDDHGWLKTFSISRTGVVGAVIDSLEYDSTYSHRPKMVHVGGSIYAIIYQHSTTTGRLVTLQIETIPVKDR